jgi:hypothetical protein
MQGNTSSTSSRTVEYAFGIQLSQGLERFKAWLVRTLTDREHGARHSKALRDDRIGGERRSARTTW